MSAEAATSEREIRRSFALGVVQGSAFRFGQALVDPPLVLTWFVSQLTSSNLLIGLVAPLGDAGWFLPQILVSTRIRRMQRRMPAYTVAAVVNLASWLALAATTGLVGDRQVLLVAFFALYVIGRVAAGSAGLVLFEIVAKTIPAERRGRFFGSRQFLGGALGLGAGWIVTTALQHTGLPFPSGHALLFAVHCVVLVPALIAFSSIREPAGTAVAELPGLRRQLRRSLPLLLENSVYRRYLATRLSLGVAGVALPFYGIYARRALGAPAGMVGTYVATRSAAMLLCDLPWGLVSDRWGNRLVTRLLCLGSSVTVLLALTLVGLVSLGGLRKALLPHLALPLFFLDGAMYPAQMLVGSNFLLELVHEIERPLCLGFSNTILGLVVLTSGLLGGFLLDLLGFSGLFAVALASSLLALFWAGKLPEPRAAQHHLSTDHA